MLICVNGDLRFLTQNVTVNLRVFTQYRLWLKKNAYFKGQFFLSFIFTIAKPENSDFELAIEAIYGLNEKKCLHLLISNIEGKEAFLKILIQNNKKASQICDAFLKR